VGSIAETQPQQGFVCVIGHPLARRRDTLLIVIGLGGAQLRGGQQATVELSLPMFAAITAVQYHTGVPHGPPLPFDELHRRQRTADGNYRLAPMGAIVIREQNGTPFAYRD
jgi:hypothetical protein